MIDLVCQIFDSSELIFKLRIDKRKFRLLSIIQMNSLILERIMTMIRLIENRICMESKIENYSIY